MSGAQILGGTSLVGHVLAGRYSIASLLGRGGMGAVYEARDRVLARDVAVKVLHGAAGGDRRTLARLRREARAAATLAHPNIVAIHDLVFEDAHAFIVMELVPGRSLSSMLDDGTPLLPAVALRIARDVADALAYAHARGVAHRDISPGNVIVRPDGCAKVLDFGLAHAEDRTPALDGSPSPPGTVAYVSPEQVEGRGGDARSDVYSLGCVVYEMLTGRPPFGGHSPGAVAAQHVRAVPVPPTVLRPEIPPGLEEVVLRCLMKEPRHRFSSGAEALAALETIDRPPAAAATLPVRPTMRAWPTPRIGEHPDTLPLPSSTPSRRRLTAAVGAVAALALLMTTVLPVARALMRQPPDGRDEPRAVLPPTAVVAAGVCDGFLKSRVDVSWTATTSDANGYEVYRSTSPTEGFEFVARVPGRETTSFRDLARGFGETYYYVVRSVAGGRLSAATETASAETPSFCLG
jgi:serine/threonine-protein kinase